MIDGLAVVDKDAGWTSHDVVARCRRVFGQRRVGHSGTLDPDATGVLLVGLGRVTRLLRFLTALPKEYEGEMVLGTATSTLDAAGEVVGEWDMAGVGLDDVRRVAGRFVGEIEQVPPMVSAVQVGGKRLHELARAGLEVDRPPRRVTVHRLEVGPPVPDGVFPIRVRCSSGTFIRTLAADIGTALGGGAHLRNLRRTAIGSFTVGEARPVDAVSGEDLLVPAAAMRDYPYVHADAATVAAIVHGQRVDLGSTAAGEGPWAVLGPHGELVAMFERRPDGRVGPAVVLPPA